jgi:hypothetical protein
MRGQELIFPISLFLLVLFERNRWESSACPIGQNAETKFSSTLFDFFGGARNRKMEKRILFRRCRRQAAARRRYAISVFHVFLLKWVRVKVSISPD